MNTPNRRLAALFTIGLVAFHSPLLGAFNRPGTVFGVPLLPLYLFFCWAALVTASAVLVGRGGRR